MIVHEVVCAKQTIATYFIIQLQKVEHKNNARIEYNYPAILYGYLDSWFFWTVNPV